MSILRLLLCAGLVFLPLYGEEAEKKEEQPRFEEKVQVVGEVSLNRTLQSVTVFRAEDMDAFRTDNLKTVLNQTPGMLVLNTGHSGQFAYSFARGASFNQALVLVDGVKVDDPSSSIGNNLSFLSTRLIDKVEVVRGPLSNLYGSSAMGGVINVVTRRKSGLDASFAFGSHDSLEGGLNAARTLGSWTLSANASLQRYSDGRVNDRFDNSGYTVNAAYARGRVSTGAQFFGGRASSGIPFNMGTPSPQREYSQNNYVLSLPLTVQLGTAGRIAARWSSRWNRYEFRDPQDTWNSYSRNASQLHEAELKWESRFFDRLDTRAGVEYSHQRITNVSGDSSLLDKSRTHFLSVFGAAAVDWRNFLFSASLRLDKYRDVDGVVSPQFGISYLIGQRVKLRASYAESFRAPTLPERLNPQWGNKDLLPERGKSWEGGVDLYLGPFTGGVTAFHSDYRQLIGYSPVTWRFANINKARITGVETSLRAEFSSLLLSVAHTWLDTLDVESDRQLLRRPRHSLAAAAAFRHRRFTLSADMVLVGKRLDYDELAWSVGRISSFDVFNFSLAVPLLPRLTVQALLTNAFNREYEEVLGYPAPLRRFSVGLRYTME